MAFEFHTFKLIMIIFYKNIEDHSKSRLTLIADATVSMLNTHLNNQYYHR